MSAKKAAKTTETQEASSPKSKEDRAPGQTGSAQQRVIPISEYRLTTVQLAVQLAAAEIQASAYTKASEDHAKRMNHLITNQIRANARISCQHNDTTNSSKDDFIAVMDKFCDNLRHDDYADMLGLITESKHLDHPDYDALFRGSMVRVQKLLRAPETDHTTVIAEQIFEPNEVLSENKIGERFSDYGWPTLKNRESYVDFMKSVNDWYAEHLKVEVLGQIEVEKGAQANFISNLLAFSKKRSHLDLYRRILQAVEGSQPASPSREETDYPTHLGFRHHMILLFFDGKAPRPRPPRSTKKSPTRFYRPWGLFRGLRLWCENDPECEKLNSLLIANRSDLNADLEPRSFDSDSEYMYDFSPLGILI